MSELRQLAAAGKLSASDAGAFGEVFESFLFHSDPG